MQRAYVCPQKIINYYQSSIGIIIIIIKKKKSNLRIYIRVTWSPGLWLTSMNRCSRMTNSIERSCIVSVWQSRENDVSQSRFTETTFTSSFEFPTSCNSPFNKCQSSLFWDFKDSIFRSTTSPASLEKLIINVFNGPSLSLFHISQPSR